MRELIDRARGPGGERPPTLESLRLLLDAGADPNLADSLLRTPLHEAVSRKSLEMTKLLVERGGDINRESFDQPEQLIGVTPLQIARDQNYQEIAAFLEGHGGRVSTAYVLERKRREAVRMLVDHVWTPLISPLFGGGH